MYTDPISDMLTRIRNASRAGHTTVTLPHSKLKEALGQLLVKEGFLSAANVVNGKFKQLELVLKYDKSGRCIIGGLERISSPGQRVYYSSKVVPRTNGGFGITIVSTSKGLMSDRQARKEKHGGEIICKVW